MAEQTLTPPAHKGADVPAKTDSPCFCEGADACRAGTALDKCPYDAAVNPKKAKDWADGWHSAEADVAKAKDEEKRNEEALLKKAQDAVEADKKYAVDRALADKVQLLRNQQDAANAKLAKAGLINDKDRKCLAIQGATTTELHDLLIAKRREMLLACTDAELEAELLKRGVKLP
jgi:hypothetical protein